VPVPTPPEGGSEPRYLMVENFARYASAFGADAMAMVRAGPALEPKPAASAVPEPLRAPALKRSAARSEIVARFVALAGPVSVDDVRRRYDFPADWVQRRLEEWERSGVLVRGVFGGDREVPRWCSRRLLEQARRRELAQARKQIEAVGLETFARFLQRWQHLTPEARLSGGEAVAAALAQLYGLARPAEGWERDYLPARVEEYDERQLAMLAASGTLVWAAEPRPDSASSSDTPTIGRIRFFERGTGRLWLAAPSENGLSEQALAVRGALEGQGASFTADLAATGLTSTHLRDALRELVAAGLATNDTVEALRDVLRWKPVFPVRSRDEPDPTRWLPADYVPSGRPIVQRRVNPRRLAKWRRPDREEPSRWGGRWSLLHLPGTLGPEADEQELAERIARQWLRRYGIVSRDWWRREHPAVGWREIYHELKRLEFRGEVQRGYFVAGLAGAQFSLPEAVEMLRAPAAGAEEIVVMAASDPANVYTLPLVAGTERDPLGRPRGGGALLVTRGGRIVLTAESRGARLRVREGASPAEVTEAARALAGRLVARQGRGRMRDVVVETIDGERAAGSRYAEAMREAGFRGMGTGLRYYVAYK
jgi:ATP-dependent helicase Lhr and Lhr-like helicase